MDTVNPARSSALITFAPGTAGRESGIRRRLGSASAHPEGRPRPAALPVRPADRQPRLPQSDRRLPPRRQDAAGRRRTRRRSRPVLRRKHMDYAGPCRFSPTRSAVRIGALGGIRPASNNRRRAAASWSASRRHGNPTRLSVHEMPMPFSTTRIRAAVGFREYLAFLVTKDCRYSAELIYEKFELPYQIEP